MSNENSSSGAGDFLILLAIWLLLLMSYQTLGNINSNLEELNKTQKESIELMDKLLRERKINNNE